ncbi:MAG TPA: low specificity L-threonine aldolase [Tepidisphaeraceae bacterium]|jgi:threonine aldolase|nr:low specificity L-threonine aldolase [Tepidisphaeraceae bacterium]
MSTLPANASSTASPLRRRNFASDNGSGVCPEVWEAMRAADAAGHCPGYGNDEWTRRASDLIRATFEQPQADVYFVFTGTAANSLALSSLCQSYHAIVCHELAHVETDECGAPEFFSNGSKIITCPGDQGKLQPATVEQLVVRRTDIHFPRPRVLSLTQTSELGTVYAPAEVAALSAVAKRHGMRVHMDGARFANAVASLGCAPAEVTWRAGVDVLSFGGTKNGMAVGDAVVFFDRALGEEFAYRCKQAGQLASKMRYLSAPWLASLNDDVWLRRAGHANAMARRLATGLGQVEGVSLPLPTQGNVVFANLPAARLAHLAGRGWRFYTFIGVVGAARFVCSWDTTEQDVDDLLADVASATAN